MKQQGYGGGLYIKYSYTAFCCWEKQRNERNYNHLNLNFIVCYYTRTLFMHCRSRIILLTWSWFCKASDCGGLLSPTEMFKCRWWMSIESLLTLVCVPRPPLSPSGRLMVKEDRMLAITRNSWGQEEYEILWCGGDSVHRRLCMRFEYLNGGRFKLHLFLRKTALVAGLVAH